MFQTIYRNSLVYLIQIDPINVNFFYNQRLSLLTRINSSLIIIKTTHYTVTGLWSVFINKETICLHETVKSKDLTYLKVHLIWLIDPSWPYSFCNFSKWWQSLMTMKLWRWMCTATNANKMRILGQHLEYHGDTD